MKDSLKIGAAIIGVMIGAGFASGQEVFLFFTSYGWIGLVGAVISGIAFGLVFMQVGKLGNIMQTTSHEKVIYKICGRYLGNVLDIVMTVYLFGILVLMVAGSGTLFDQQFGLPKIVGSLLMVILTILSVNLNMKNILTILAAFTPILLIAIIGLGIYSILTTNLTLVEIESMVDPSQSAAPHWLLGTLLYISMITATGFAMLTVIGGSTEKQKIVNHGGVLGGVGFGVFIVLFHIALMSKFDQIQYVEMPTLLLFAELSPWLGFAMAVLIFGMIFNTAVGMLYSFSVRLTRPDHPKFKLRNIYIGVIAFLLSFVGFTKLIGFILPAMGYIGFPLIGGIIISYFRFKEKAREKQPVITEQTN